jgi:nitrous oxidase accessory protein
MWQKVKPIMKIQVLKTAVLSLLLLGMAFSVFNIASVAFSQKTRQVPAEYSTIQEAIDASNLGDVVYVSKGTYYEHLVITKDCLMLIGENFNTTIIDGNQTGAVIKVSANNVTITGFTIRGSGEGKEGIYLDHSSNSTIVDNIIHNCSVGIRVHNDSSGKIIGNNIANNDDSGIILQVNTINTHINGNNITNNRYVGINIFAYADNNTISENIIMNNSYSGIQLYLALGNKVNGNILMLNERGITFLGQRASYNNISSNVIAQNIYGIDFMEVFAPRYNVIYHNDIVGNTYQLQGNSTGNIWNNTASEGNYWSDYEGEDLDSDGIGDTNTPHHGVDSYPLDNPRSPIPLILNGQLYRVRLRSSSVVSRFYFKQESREIGFKVIGPIGTQGYCNITIPKNLLNPMASQSWMVLLDGANLDVTIAENATSTSLYFSYNHSIHDVRITVGANNDLIFYIIGIVVSLVLVVGTAIALIKRKQRGRRLANTNSHTPTYHPKTHVFAN